MKHVVLIAPAIEDYCVEYANAVATRSKVTLICSKSHFMTHAAFVDPAVDLRMIDWPRHRSPWNVVFIVRLARLIHALRPDVVHFLSEGVLWLNLLVPIIRKYGIVTTVHDVSYHPGDNASQRIPRWSANFLIANSDRLIVHGATLRAQAERIYPKLAGRIEILPHRPITKYWKIAQDSGLRRAADTGVSVLFFGRIYAYKGLDVLLRSSARIIDQFDDIRFVIAGRGDDMEKYERMMSDKKYFKIINKFIPDAETARLFTDADIIALPYLEASQSGVLAIANAFGKPVIVTNVGELGHSVEDGVSGLVIPPNDPAALAEAVLRLARDAELRRRLGEAGRLAGQAATAAEPFAEKAARMYEAVSHPTTRQSRWTHISAVSGA